MFGITLTIGLLLGVLLTGGVMFFMNDRRRRTACAVRRNRLTQIVLPTSIAVAVCILAWAGLSLLFPTGEPSPADTGSNTITQRLTMADASANPAPAITPESPMVKAAMQNSPVASRLSSVGLQIAGSAQQTGDSQPQEVPPARQAVPAAPAPQTPPARPAPVTAAKPVVSTAGTAPAGPVRSGLKFTVHLASFSIKDNADTSLARLKSAGLPAFVRRVEVNSKLYYRLMVGQFDSRAEAEAYGLDIQRKGYTGGLGQYVVKPLITGPEP